MNTLATNHRSLPSETAKHQLLPLQETKELMSLAKEHRWGFQVLGNAPMPEQPVRLGDWLLVPALFDSSPILSRALERIQAIFAAGIRPQGFVLVHEAPMLISAPAETQVTERNAALNFLDHSVSPRPADFAALFGAGIAAASGLAAMAIGALTLLATLALPVTLMAGALLLDPILVVVTKDGYWVEIDRWSIDPGS